MIMGNSEDFQRQFTSLMKNLLHCAVTETTKLFESTVHEMTTELMRRQQNDQIKDNVTTLSNQGGCMLNCQGNPCKQDIGIQCGITSTPAEESHIPSSQHEDEDKTRFSDLFPGLLPEGNEQFTLLFIKPEEADMCGYTPACLLPKLADDQPFMVQRIEAPVVNQEAGHSPGNLSPYQGLSDHPFTHNHTPSSPPHPLETPQSQESNPPANPCVSVEVITDRLEESPVMPPQPLVPTASSFQTDVANGSKSASPDHVANISYGDQPRRVSTRKSKSVYRHLVTLEMGQLNENIQKTNDTCSPKCHVPADSQRETDKKTSEQLSRNHLDKNLTEGQQPGMTQRLKNQCEVCQLVLSSASALKHHWEVHGAGRDSVCYMCGKIFPSDRSLRSHLLIHTLDKHNRCSGDEATEADGEINQEILVSQQNSPQDQPRRLSARKSKSVYRRVVDLESPQPSVEIFQQTNDTSSTCLVPTKVLKKTDDTLKNVSDNQLDKNQDDGDQLGMDQTQKNQCEVCALVLNSASALKQHWKVHTTETDSVCYRCGKIFPDVRSLRCHEFIHTLGKHRQCSEDKAMSKTEQADCKIDQKIIPKSGSYQNTYQDQPRRFSARKSKSVYRRPVDLETTQPSVENVLQTQSPGFSTCRITTETTDKKNFRPPGKSKSYKNRQCGTDRQKNQCEVCGRILCNASSLLHHLRVHRGERPFVCDRCGKGFAHKRSLRRHLQTHTLAKHSWCSEVVAVPETQNVNCDIDQQSLTLLQNSHQDQPTRSSVRKSKSVDRRWVGLETEDTSASTSHFPEEVHKIIYGDPTRINANEHQCGVCGMSLISAAALLFHQGVHRERSFGCDQCGKAFPDEEGLRRHAVIHRRDKRHQCLQCGKTFSYRCLLTRHQVEHTGEKPFPCGVCGKRFASKVSQAIHTRMHAGERPHSCALCNKAFTKKASLKAHMLKHRGEKP